MARFTRILSIDGGGIRGIIPAQTLVALENKLHEKTGTENARIADFFDLITGTSTGGILTCIYLCPDPTDRSRPRFSAADAVDLYLERGSQIFRRSLWHRLRSGAGFFDEKYPADGIETALKEYLGELKLSDLLKPCLITAYDIKRRRTFFFTQHDAKIRPSRNFLLRDVARATSAAPVFFECAEVTSDTNVAYPMIDGGVFANNPALCAYAEARTMGSKPTAKDMVILSLGTGEAKKGYPYREAKGFGAGEWLLPVLDIMMSAVGEVVDYQLTQMFDAVGKREQYLRIQTKLARENADMDNVERDNLLELRELGTLAAEDNNEQLDKFVELLLAEEERQVSVPITPQPRATYGA